jgi:hypothetical protein
LGFGEAACRDVWGVEKKVHFWGPIFGAGKLPANKLLGIVYAEKKTSEFGLSRPVSGQKTPNF